MNKVLLAQNLDHPADVGKSRHPADAPVQPAYCRSDHFFVAGAEQDMGLPRYGERSLRSYFRRLAYASGLSRGAAIPIDPGV